MYRTDTEIIQELRDEIAHAYRKVEYFKANASRAATGERGAMFLVGIFALLFVGAVVTFVIVTFVITMATIEAFKPLSHSTHLQAIQFCEALKKQDDKR